jgi:hypothetical protein
MLTLDRPGLFWPLVIIGAGALLLLDNLGWLPAGLWAALAQLWPVLIILLGLDMLLGRRTPVRVSAVLVLGGLLVAGALTWAAIRASQLPPGAAQALSQAPLGAERLEVTLAFNTGELNVSALGPSASALEGTAQNGPGETARLDYAVSDGVGRLTLEQSAHPVLAPFVAAQGGHARWEVGLTPGLPLALDVRTGAGFTALDLTGLDLETLSLRSGVGQTVITFPAGGAAASVVTGLGDTTLYLPDGQPARITVRSGLANVSVPSRFSRADEVYTTPGFDPDGAFLDQQVRAGLGRVTIR